jgi:hypothetical protein
MVPPRVIAGLAPILSKHDINIDAVFQNSDPDKAALPFVMTLEATWRSQASLAALSEIKRSSFLIAALRLPILY